MDRTSSAPAAELHGPLQRCQPGALGVSGVQRKGLANLRAQVSDVGPGRILSEEQDGSRRQDCRSTISAGR